jgi:hypothetical protein
MQSLIGQVPEGDIPQQLSEVDSRFLTIAHQIHIYEMKDESCIKK